jgi:hypothetical protein
MLGRKEATYGTLLESPVRSAQPGNQFKMLKEKNIDFSRSKLKIEAQNFDLKVLEQLSWPISYRIASSYPQFVKRIK